VSDIAKLLGQKTVMPILKLMFEKNIIHISEEVSDRYKPRRVRLLPLTPYIIIHDQLKELFSILEKRAPKQPMPYWPIFSYRASKKRFLKNELTEASGAGSRSY
jgi:primosomal protein N' (replication factor Y)